MTEAVRGARAVSLGGLSAAFRVVITWLVIGALPIAFAAATFSSMQGFHLLAFDFAGPIWRPLRLALHGANPYPAATREGLSIGNPAVYPPVSFLMLAPIAALSYHLAAVVWTSMLVASVPLSLFIVGVRDPRCYVAAMLCYPVVLGLIFGNMTVLLMPLLAVVWATRRRTVACGSAAALAVVLKLFLIPLILWLFATRRYRAALTATAGALLAIFGPWALIGFRGLSAYPQLMRVEADIYLTQSRSVTGWLTAVGGSRAAATVAALVIAAALTLGAVALGRRGRDAHCFALLIVACIVATPIVWEHYFALFLLPISILRPTFGWQWAAVSLLWFVGYLPHSVPGPCCAPPGISDVTWQVTLHGSAPVWQMATFVLLTAGFAALVMLDGFGPGGRGPLRPAGAASPATSR